MQNMSFILTQSAGISHDFERIITGDIEEIHNVEDFLAMEDTIDEVLVSLCHEQDANFHN